MTAAERHSTPHLLPQHSVSSSAATPTQSAMSIFDSFEFKEDKKAKKKSRKKKSRSSVSVSLARK